LQSAGAEIGRTQGFLLYLSDLIFIKNPKSMSNDDLLIRMHGPEDGYYLGTRFDHSGNFLKIKFKGLDYVEPWFDSYSPVKHDAVCGPAEEFSPIGEAERHILKIGVGLIERDDAPYDRFNLYPVLDPGTWTCSSEGNRHAFRHRISAEGYGYDYSKEVLPQEDGFILAHRLENTGEKPLKGDVYNHNFFTFSNLQVGPSRTLDFPFSPEGHWREVYDSVALQEGGIRFSRILQDGEKVFMGDLHAAGRTETPYRFILREGGRGVEITGDRPVTHCVFWSNHHVSCIEPYIRFDIMPGASFTFNLRYRLF